jgi:hypothetical protein
MWCRKVWAGLVGIILSMPLAMAQAPVKVQPGTPVTIQVIPAAAPPPAVSITLGTRHGHVTPSRSGFMHTGGGNIDVGQPTPDSLVVTMTGATVAGGHPCKDSAAALHFDLVQSFDVSFDNPKVKKAKLTIEGRVIGLLRSECKGSGSATEGPGCATISGEQAAIVNLCVPEHSVGTGESLSINDHEGPVEVSISAGKYTLHQTFLVSTAHGRTLCLTKAASAEFAPDPALDPLWISYWEPFHGAVKKDFGFQITIKVAEAPG